MSSEVKERPRARSTRRDVSINLRASAQERDLFDRAASVIGTTRTEFMLESARLRATDVLLEQKLFVLEKNSYAAFIKLLDEPAPPTAKLRRLFSKKAPWEK